jgi:hypothetical protein
LYYWQNEAKMLNLFNAGLRIASPAHDLFGAVHIAIIGTGYVGLVSGALISGMS